MMLATLRRIPQTHASLAVDRQWRGDFYSYDNCGLEIEDTPVGLVGYGAIGSRVAKVLAAFGAEVLVHDPYARGEIVGERVDTLDELLTRARIVTLHARVTPDTRGLIGARELGLMPPGSVLINVARGPLLDYDALCDALDSGQLMAAGLDTFYAEPFPADSRLYSTPNIVMTPHLGGASRAVAHKAARIVAAEVGRYTRGEPLAHCMNP
jgi:D-3-phosphoglycerate dehydrogenase